jgi:hypothetical protein
MSIGIFLCLYETTLPLFKGAGGDPPGFASAILSLENVL